MAVLNGCATRKTDSKSSNKYIRRLTAASKPKSPFWKVPTPKHPLRQKIHHRKPDQQNARTHAANLPLQPLRGQDLPRNRRNYRNQCAQRHSQYPTGFGHHANRTERLSHHFNYRPVFQRYTIIKKITIFLRKFI